jgi:hypothetical protein
MRAMLQGEQVAPDHHVQTDPTGILRLLQAREEARPLAVRSKLTTALRANASGDGPVASM